MTNETYDPDFIIIHQMNGDGTSQVIKGDGLQGAKESGKGIWIHLNYSNHAFLEEIRKVYGMDEVVVEALEAESTRPRSMAFNEGLLVSLRGVNLNPGAEPEDMVSIRVWLTPDIIVTTSKRKLVSVKDLQEQFDQAKGAISTSDLLVCLVDRLVWRMSDVVEEMEDQMDELEEQLMNKAAGSLRLDLAMLRRQSIALRRHLAPQREALSRLSTEKVDWFGEGNRIYLREALDRMIRHIEDIDAIRERAAITQEELNSRHSEQLNSKMYILSVVAAIFLPLGFLTGLFGINVGGIPGSENPDAFMIFVLGIIVATVVQTAVFRWKKWL